MLRSWFRLWCIDEIAYVAAEQLMLHGDGERSVDRRSYDLASTGANAFAPELVEKLPEYNCAFVLSLLASCTWSISACGCKMICMRVHNWFSPLLSAIDVATQVPLYLMVMYVRNRLRLEAQ